MRLSLQFANPCRAYSSLKGVRTSLSRCVVPSRSSLQPACCSFKVFITARLSSTSVSATACFTSVPTTACMHVFYESSRHSDCFVVWVRVCCPPCALPVLCSPAFAPPSRLCLLHLAAPVLPSLFHSLLRTRPSLLIVPILQFTFHSLWQPAISSLQSPVCAPSSAPSSSLLSCSTSCCCFVSLLLLID